MDRSVFCVLSRIRFIRLGPKMPPRVFEDEVQFPPQLPRAKIRVMDAICAM